MIQGGMRFASDENRIEVLGSDGQLFRPSLQYHND